MEQQRIHIEFLIRAINYFVSHPDEEFYDDIPKKAINHLTYQEIKLFDPLLKYKDFKKSTLEERQARLKSYLSKTVVATVPQNLDLLLEQAEDHEKSSVSQTEKRKTYQKDYRWAANFAKRERALALEMQSTEILVEDAVELAVLPVAVNTVQKKDLFNQVSKNPEQLVKKISNTLVVETQPETQEQVKEIEDMAKSYVDQVASLSEDAPFLMIDAPKIKKAFEEGKQIEINDALVGLPQPTEQDIKNVRRLLQADPKKLKISLTEEIGEEFAESLTSEIVAPSAFLPIIPVIQTSVGLETAVKAQEVIAQVAGGPVVDTIFSQISVQPPVPTESLTPFQSTMIPIATIVARGTEKTEKGIANDLFLVHGVTSKSKDFELVTSRLNLNNEQLYLVKEQLNTLERAFPGYKPNINELFSIVTGQVSLMQIGDGTPLPPGDAYQNYTQIFPPVTGIRGFFMRSFQQTFGRVANNYVNGAIKNGLAKAGAAVAKKAVTSALGKALTGAALAASNALPLLGPIFTWLATNVISKLAPLIKKYIVPIITALAGIAGFVVFGPVGAIVGGIGGAAVAGGVTGGGISAGVATVTSGVAALAGAFASAIAVPLIIAAIGIPVSVGLILFIINSGAYVVPSSGAVAVTGPGCPAGWPVDDPIIIAQGPQGASSHQGYEAIDIDKTTGTPVRATHSGVALVLDFDGKSFGLNVRITSNCNGKQFQTVYGHLNTVAVSDKQVVSAGEIIGTIDSTGNSTGPHLHYEFRPGWGTDDGPVNINQEPLLMGPPYIPRAVR